MDAERRRQMEILLTEPCLPWSGRARYAAAMSLYQFGDIDADVLEIYRICSRLDCDDPLAVLERHGLGADFILALATFRDRGGVPPEAA